MHALTRAVPRSLGACELTFVDRMSIDVARARVEHDGYVAALRRCGVDVTVLPADDTQPDSVFVEDPVLVLDEVVLALPMGAVSRKREADALIAQLERDRPVARLAGSGTVEGGDVLRAGRDLYVGVSRRSDVAGIHALRDAVARFGYRVHPVAVTGCLHLKTACTRVGDHFLVNDAWIDVSGLGTAPRLGVPPSEPFGANTLTIDNVVFTMASCPSTAALLEGEGFHVESVDITELQKAEAGLTCLGVVFETST